jgi:hypothetical protein
MKNTAELFSILYVQIIQLADKLDEFLSLGTLKSQIANKVQIEKLYSLSCASSIEWWNRN